MNLQQVKVLRTISKIVLLLTGLFLLGYMGYVVYMGVRYKPYKVRVTNVTDSAFTVSWITDTPMPGIVYYGEKDTFLPGPLAWIGKKKAVDDRDSSDAMSECVSKFNKKAAKSKDANFTVDASGFNCNDVKVFKYGKYYTHHITVQNLDAEKEYFFRVGDGVISYGKSYGGTFAEREMPAISEFKSKTLPVITKVEAPNPAYGTSYNMYIDKFGMMAKKENFDSIIFLRSFDVNVDNYPLLSSVSNSDGGWSIDLANIRDAQNQPVSIDGLTLEFIPQVDNAIPLNIDRSLVYKEDIFPLSLLGNREEDWEVEGDADENTALSWLHSKLTSKTNAVIWDNGDPILINGERQPSGKPSGSGAGGSSGTGTGGSSGTGTGGSSGNSTACIKSTLQEPYAASGCDEHATCHWRYRIGGTGYVCGYTEPLLDVQYCRPPGCMNVYSRPGDRELEKDDSGHMVPMKRYVYDSNKNKCVVKTNYQSGGCTPSNGNNNNECMTLGECQERVTSSTDSTSSVGGSQSGAETTCPTGYVPISGIIGNAEKTICVTVALENILNGMCNNNPNNKQSVSYKELGNSNNRTFSGVFSCSNNPEKEITCYVKGDVNCNPTSIKGTECNKNNNYYATLCDCNPDHSTCTGKSTYYTISDDKTKCSSVEYTKQEVDRAMGYGIGGYGGRELFTSPTNCETFLREKYNYDSLCGEFKVAVSAKKGNTSIIACMDPTVAEKFEKDCNATGLSARQSATDGFLLGYPYTNQETSEKGRYPDCPDKKNVIPVEISDSLELSDVKNLKCCPYASTTSSIEGYKFLEECQVDTVGMCDSSLSVTYCLNDKDNIVPVVSVTSSSSTVCKGQGEVIRQGEKAINGKYCCYNPGTRKYSVANCQDNYRKNWNECVGQPDLVKEMEFYDDITLGEDGGDALNLLNKKFLFKSLAQEEDDIDQVENQVLYYPGEGMYEVTIAGGRKISLIGEDDISYFFYKDNDGVPGYQAPQDPNNPKESEDMILPKSVVLFSSQTAITTKYSLKRGINIVSFGFMPSKGGNEPKLNSVEFLELVNMGENKVSAISYFEAGKWSGGTTYDFNTKETKGTVFDLVFGRGYVVIAEQDTTISIPGLKLDKSVPVAFSRGWNLVGIHGYSTAYTARTLIESINTIEGLKSDNVTWWPTSRGMYQGYQLINGQSYGQDYPISPLNGYFVRISEFNPKDPSCKTLWWNPGGNYNGQCDK